MNAQEEVVASEGSLFGELIKVDRKLELDYEYACDDAPETAGQVRAIAENYLEGYTAFNKITRETVLSSYAETVRRYANDIRVFVETGKYPLELNREQPLLSRIDYDLFLILTILVTKHRCAIMEELTKLSVADNALVIGVGSGVELSFLGHPRENDAYDLYVNPYARSAFPQWSFREELYRPGEKHYSAIYAIELLEHLEQPYEFLADCRESLLPDGRLVVTTATNVPQFDHRFNFVSDEDFESRAAALGLKVDYKHVIPHAYPRTNIGARNVFYCFVCNG